MTSILDQLSNQRTRTHACGGTILVGGEGELQHQYCDKCGAFTYDLNAPMPDGTDHEANRRAYDDGDSASPSS